jgi:dTMP kinase
VSDHGHPGLLVVLEGIDRSGRSTHARLLEAHLRHRGRAVTRTSLGTAQLAGPPIRQARADRQPDATEIALLYAADLAERIEQVVEPALRAGLIVLADRYRWTPMARAAARGVDVAWLATLFAFAPNPDLVLWLDVDVRTSLKRRDTDPDPFEAGLDLGLSADARESYALYQARLAAAFADFAIRDGFLRVPADGPPEAVEPVLEAAVDALLEHGPSAPPGIA